MSLQAASRLFFTALLVRSDQASAPNRLRHRRGLCDSISCQEASVRHRCDACRRASHPAPAPWTPQPAMSGRRRTTASSAPRCTQSYDNSSIESPTPTNDDRQPLSQTDNRTPVVERRRRLSGAAPLHNLRKAKTIQDRVYGAVTLPGVFKLKIL